MYTSFYLCPKLLNLAYTKYITVCRCPERMTAHEKVFKNEEDVGTRLYYSEFKANLRCIWAFLLLEGKENSTNHNYTSTFSRSVLFSNDTGKLGKKRNSECIYQGLPKIRNPKSGIRNPESGKKK